MKNITSISVLRQHIQQWTLKGLRIGFVPTMGNLHAGHMALINQANTYCDKVVVSIFVNPLQFNQTLDFESYPKTIDADQQKLIDANTDLLFLPSIDIIYPNGQENVTKICVPGISSILEGECRPGHFDGVSTVVHKLFNLVQPHVAFFGEKDYQQLLLIKKMVEDLNFPIEIKSVATCRESDGLAMSSRNSRLSKEHRKMAPLLFEVLQNVSKNVLNAKKSLVDIEHQAVDQLIQGGFDVEYLAIRKQSSLQEANIDDCANKKLDASRCLVLVAVNLGGVRLIDNLIL